MKRSPRRYYYSGRTVANRTYALIGVVLAVMLCVLSLFLPDFLLV